MIRWLVVAGAVLAACLHDHYECTQDSDCNLGSGGRCEVDHACTLYDLACPTERRYAPHSGATPGACFDGRATPLDPCAAGQPPAPPIGCAATVCAALPACCATGWSEACALTAQLNCPDVTCDTRIALTATKGAKTELWELVYDGATWTATPHSERQGLMTYLAPAPGETEPRLAGFVAPSTLVVSGGRSELDIALDPAHDYHDLASLDFDRDLRDTAVLDWQDTGSSDQEVEVLKLDTGSARELPTGESTRETWGDYDHDAYPDGVAATGARYNFLVNLDAPDHTRVIDASISSSFTGAGTTGAPATRNFAWADLDGDGVLDLVAAGNSLRIHRATTGRISDTPQFNIDCEPPALFGTSTSCNAGSGDDTASWSAGVLPIDGGGDVIAASFPTRKLYRVHVTDHAAISTIPLPAGSCPACPYLAVVVRDLDGDHLPDLVAIDSMLGLAVALSSNNLQLVEVRPFTPINGPFTVVRASVTGARL